jgi:tetratricopeptide (TPR) repeat protein
MIAMDESILSNAGFAIGIAGNLLASIMYDAALGRYRGFNDALFEAAVATSSYFSRERQVEFDAQSLLELLNGKHAEDVQRFKDGDRFIEGDRLAVEFVRAADLYFDDESVILPIAKEILSDFVRRLEHILIRSPETGLAMVMSYVRAIREQATGDHREVMDSLSLVEAELNSLPSRILQRFVALPFAEYVSYDQKLQSLSQECGIPAAELKSKIDDWLHTVNSPYVRGLYHLSTENYESALTLLRSAVAASESELADRYASLGAALLDHKDNPSAIAVLKKALVLNERNATAHGLVATASLNERDFDSAVAHQEIVANLEPRSSRAICMLGVTYSAQSNLAKAAECYLAALKIDPTNADARLNLARAYVDQGRSDLAIASFEEALRHEQSPVIRAFALDGLACLHDNLGDLEKAKALHQEAIQVLPDNPALYCNLGVLYGRQGQFDAAIPLFIRACTIEPRYDGALMNLGIAYQHQGRLEDALDAFGQVIALSPQEALTFNPNYVEAYRSMADVCNLLERHAEARQYAMKSLELDPDSMAAHTAAGVACQRSGDYVNAQKHYARTVEISPDRPEGHYNLACVAALTGDQESAIRLLRTAAGLDPGMLETARRDRDFTRLVATTEFQKLSSELQRRRSTRPHETSRDWGFTLVTPRRK